MIILSEKTLGLIEAEVQKPHIQKAVTEDNLTPGSFSAELQAALAEDAGTDGTGATMIPQIISVVSQLVGVLHGLRPNRKPPAPQVMPPHVAPVVPGSPPVAPTK